MAEEIGPHTIAIIGAGVAGPVFALTILSNPILRQRYKPVIFERLPCPTSVSPIETSHSENQNRDNSGEAHREATYAAGAAVALTSNALYPLYNLGLRSSLDKFSYETTRIKIWRAWGGNGEGEHQYFNQINNPNWQEDLGTCLRVVERAQLQRLVLDRVQELGGTVIWGRKLKDIQAMKQEGVKLLFEGGEEFIAGLVVGADGGWSAVRQHIIMSSNKKGNDDVAGKVEDRWKPDFAGADGIYGVSSPLESSGNDRDGTEEGDKDDLREGDTHWVLLDSGTASTWSLPGGRQFWTISFPSDVPPNRRIKGTGEQLPALGKLYGADVTLGGYEFKETEEILKKYENAWHPIAGSFGELFRKSERIVRAPLWYRAWETNEIGGKNAVVIGDAARLMLPTSGQGTSPLLPCMVPSLKTKEMYNFRG